MNTLVASYRATEKGKKDPKSAYELTLEFGDAAKKTPGKWEELVAKYPDAAKQYEELAAERRAETTSGTIEGIKNVAKNAWDSSVQALNAIGGVGEEDAQDIASREWDIQNRKTSGPWQDWQAAQGAEAAKVFLRDPIEITSNIIASGLAGSVPSLAAGAAGGLAQGAATGTLAGPGGTIAGGALGAGVGAGVGSLATEYGAKYLEVLREAGADLTDPESIVKFASDKALTDRAMELGLRRGIPVAVFDALSAGLAGKLFKAAKGAGRGAVAAAGAGEAAVQGGLGGAGEVAGSLVAGEKINPKAVFEEVIGEVGPGAVEVGLGTMRGSSRETEDSEAPPPVDPRVAARAAAAQMAAPPPVAPPDTPPAAPSLSRVVAARTQQQNEDRLRVLEATETPTPDEIAERDIIRALLGLTTQPAAQASAAAKANEETLQGKKEEVVPPAAPASLVSAGAAVPPAAPAPPPAALAPTPPPPVPAPVAAPTPGPAPSLAGSAPNPRSGAEAGVAPAPVPVTVAPIPAPVPAPAPITPPAVETAQQPTPLNNVQPATAAPSAGTPVPAAAPVPTRPTLPQVKVNVERGSNDRAFFGSGLVNDRNELLKALPKSQAKTVPTMAAFLQDDGRVIVTPIKYGARPITKRDGTKAVGHRAIGVVTADGVFNPEGGTHNIHIDDMPGKPVAVLRADTAGKFVFQNMEDFSASLKESGVVDHYEAARESAKQTEKQADELALQGDESIISEAASPWVVDGKIDLEFVPIDSKELLKGIQLSATKREMTAKEKLRTAIALRSRIGLEIEKYQVGDAKRADLTARFKSAARAVDTLESVGVQANGVVPISGSESNNSSADDVKYSTPGDSAESGTAEAQSSEADATPDQGTVSNPSWRAFAVDNAKVEVARVWAALKDAAGARTRSAKRQKTSALSELVAEKSLLEFLPAGTPEFFNAFAKRLGLSDARALATHAEKTWEASDPGNARQFLELFAEEDPNAPASRREAELEQSRHAREFTTIVNRLTRAGVRVDLIARAFLQGKAVGQTYGGYHIAVALKDVRSPDIFNLVTLLHEAGHAVLRRRDPKVKRVLDRAVEALIARARKAGAVTGVNPSTNIGVSYEEALVEAVAQELVAEGAADGASLAKQIVSWVKDLYGRLVMAVQQWMGVGTSPEFFEQWFKNHMAGLVGDRFDHRLADLFVRPIARPLSVVTRDLAGLDRWRNPFKGEMEKPMVLPDMREAADWTPSASTDLDRQTSEVYTQAAGLNLFKAALDQAQGSMKLEDFWKIVGQKDHPSKVLDALEGKVRGASTMVVTDDKLTPAIREQSYLTGYRLIRKVERSMRNEAAALNLAADRAADSIADKAKAVNELEGKFRDMSVHESQFQATLKGLVSDLAGQRRESEHASFKAGRLAEAIAQIDKRLQNAPIPEEYQRVFKLILDGKIAVGDYMAAMSKLNIAWASKSASDVYVEVISAAPTDPVLQKLIENRPLFIALVALARKQYRQMDLLALSRTTKAEEFLAITKELEEIRRATPDVLKKTEESIAGLLKSTSLAERLRGQYVEARRDLRQAQNIILKAEESVDLLLSTAQALDAAAKQIEPNLGAHSLWVPADGAQWFSMVRKGEGWHRDTRTLSFSSDGRSTDPEMLDRLDLNKQWLAENISQKGTRAWNEVERQTTQLLLGDFVQARHATHRFMLDSITQSLQKRFASLGRAASTAISRMLFRFQTIVDGEADALERKTVSWQRAATEAAKAAGYKGDTMSFYDDILTHVVYAVESEPGKGEAAAIKTAVKAARERLRDPSAEADDFADRLGDLLREHKAISEYLVSIAEKNGVFIADETLSDPLALTKEGLMRHAISYGWLTSTRKMRTDVVSTLTQRMRTAGWQYEVIVKEMGNRKTYTLDKESIKIGEFTPEVVQDFIDPFMRKPGASVFRTPGGDPIPQVEVAVLWKESGKNVEEWMKLMDKAYPRMSVDGEGAPAGTDHWLGRIQELYVKMVTIAVDSQNVGSVLDANYMVQPHRLMDARKDDIIPPEFLEYDTFDKSSARIALAQIAFTASFGRNGRDMVGALAALKAQMKSELDIWTQYRGSKRALEAAGFDYRRLKQVADNHQSVTAWEADWLTAFGAGQTSQMGDLRVGLDALRFVTNMTLNQPTSGLWNWMSTVEFPTVYGGINKSAMRAAARAITESTLALFGRLGEAVGTDALRRAEYRDVVDALQNKRGVSASYADLMLDAGVRGKMEQEGKLNKTQRIIRGANSILRKTNLLSPFRVLNEAAGEGIIRGQLAVFETMIGKAIKYFDAHPEALRDPNFRFDAADLGMKGAGLFGDETTYTYFRERAADYGVGAIEDIARSAMERIAKGERMLTRDQAIAIGTMALNDVALESSVNSRPEWTRHPAVQWAMPLLGWPIAKMGAVNESFKGADGSGVGLSVRGAKNFARGMALILGWTLPAGLVASMMMDEWDEEVKGKKANRTDVDWITGLPIVGPALALVGAGDKDPWVNFIGMSERAIRAGTYGIGTELLAQFWAPLDATSGQKTFSLDNRVYLVSAIRSVQQAVGSWVGGEAATYANVGRPLLQSVGGNGPLEGVAILSNLLDLDTSERRIARRTSMRNWLTAAGKEAGIDVRPRISMSVTPSPTSIWVREMELAALADDRVRFGEAYRNAVDAARRNSEADPEQAILNSWRSKHPFSVFTSKELTDAQRQRLNAALGDEGREIVGDGLANYEKYTRLIEPSSLDRRMKRMMSSVSPERLRKQVDPETLRRQAAQW